MPFEIKCGKDEWSLASMVASNVEIKDVILTGASVEVDKTLMETGTPKCEVELQPLYDGYRLLEERILVADVGLIVKYLIPSQEGEEQEARNLASLEVKMSVGYALPPPPIPDDIRLGFDSFAKHNGLFNCWPFLRQHVSYLSNSIRLPFIVPVLKILHQDSKQVEQASQTGEQKVKLGKAAKRKGISGGKKQPKKSKKPKKTAKKARARSKKGKA